MNITAIQLLHSPAVPAQIAEGTLDGILCTLRVSEDGLPEAFLETGPETVDLEFAPGNVVRGYLVIRNRVSFSGYLYLSGDFVPDA